MTNTYHRDLAAIDAMIAALPGGLSATAQQMLNQLKTLLTVARTNAGDLVAKVTDTRAKYDVAFPDDVAAVQEETRHRLTGLKAAGKGKHKSRLELIVSFSEDGGSGTSANNSNFIKRLRDALDRVPSAGHPNHHNNKADLAASALATGQSVRTFCNGLKFPDPNNPGTFLLASAIDLLLPLTVGLWPEHQRVLEILRENIRKGGGGGEGSCLWPSGYVTSSSSSSSGG